jgi:hypothetical protein
MLWHGGKENKEGKLCTNSRWTTVHCTCLCTLKVLVQRHDLDGDCVVGKVSAVEEGAGVAGRVAEVEVDGGLLRRRAVRHLVPALNLGDHVVTGLDGGGAGAGGGEEEGSDKGLGVHLEMFVGLELKS